MDVRQFVRRRFSLTSTLLGHQAAEGTFFQRPGELCPAGVHRRFIGESPVMSNIHDHYRANRTVGRRNTRKRGPRSPGFSQAPRGLMSSPLYSEVVAVPLHWIMTEGFDSANSAPGAWK